MTEFRRIALKTGVTLNVALSGPADAPAVILLHGFPKSHRTWRELAPRLAAGCGWSCPTSAASPGRTGPPATAPIWPTSSSTTSSPSPTRLAWSVLRWSGTTGAARSRGAAAVRGDPRLSRLAIINAPHPVVFQKSLIENLEQRSAAQYITTFRIPGFAGYVKIKGFDWFFEKTFGPHVDLSLIPETEKQQYIAEWSQPGALAAMLNWYRASSVFVPPPGISIPIPDWALKPSRRSKCRRW